MSKTWKWIIGILIGLLIVAVIVAIPVGLHQLAVRNSVRMSAQGFDRDYSRGFGPGMMGQGGQQYYYHQGMMNQGYGFFPPMAYGFGFFAFGILRLIVPLTLIGFAIYGVVALFRRKPSAPVAVEAVPAPAPVSTRSCGNCGKPAQDDWKNCPYCGNSL